MEFERLGSPPPPSDTGVEITAGVHWLTLTIWGGSVPEVEALVVSHFFAGHAGESLWELMGGARYFDARYELAGYDVTIYAGPAGKRRGSEEYLSIEIKGSALERLGSDGLKSLMTDLSVRWQVTSSRIDVALDGAPFTPEWFEDQCEAGNLRSRVKRAPESEWLSGSWTRSGQKRNRTVYLGSRQSDKHLRVYDRRGFTRCELECKRDAATALVRILDSIAVEEWPAILTGAVDSFCAIVDSSGDPNITRAPHLPPWAALVRGSTGLSLALPKRPVTFESKMDWIERSVSPTMSALVEVLGPVAGQAWLNDVIRHGRFRYGPRQRFLVAEAKDFAES